MACLVAVMTCHETGARADLLAAYPSEVTLDHGSDVQQMVVVGSRSDGVTQDLTRQSTFTFEAEGIAQLDETFRLKPIADGDTVLTIHVEGQCLTVPVHVKRSKEHPSVSFRNDVQAVLMRTGCNSGGCHGSAQGKNGFRLSLFGFDPGLDYMGLTRDVRGRRLNTANPDESLMLLKPTGGVDHEGHRRPASRWWRIFPADKRLAVCCLRSRTRQTNASGSGRLARLISSMRRYSCNDRPDLAARAASSSRALSGTSRMVIDAMHASSQRCLGYHGSASVIAIALAIAISSSSTL